MDRRQFQSERFHKGGLPPTSVVVSSMWLFALYLGRMFANNAVRSNGGYGENKSCTLANQLRALIYGALARPSAGLAAERRSFSISLELIIRCLLIHRQTTQTSENVRMGCLQKAS